MCGERRVGRATTPANGVPWDRDRLLGDVHASGAFRAELLSTYAERSLQGTLDSE